MACPREGDVADVAIQAAAAAAALAGDVEEDGGWCEGHVKCRELLQGGGRDGAGGKG